MELQWLLAAWAFAVGVGIGWIIHEGHEGHKVENRTLLKIKNKFIRALRVLRG